MNKCIICEKTKEENELSIEHIIPEALGNKELTINSVCKECNSKLGSNVDKYITTGEFANLIRRCYNLEGKNKKIPITFVEATDKQGHQVVFDKENTPHYVAKKERINNGWAYIGEKAEDILKMINKDFERGKINLEQKEKLINELYTLKPIKNSHLNVKIKINYKEIKLSIIKIAYEYAWLKLKDTYFYDECAITMRKILQKAINEQQIETYEQIENISHQEYINLSKMCKDENILHILQMIKDKNRIWLLVSLCRDENLSYKIKISNNANRYAKTYFSDIILLKNNMQFIT